MIYRERGEVAVEAKLLWVKVEIIDNLASNF